MNNDKTLFDELRRHDLIKTLITKRVIAEEASTQEISDEKVEAAKAVFLKRNNLESKEELQSYLDLRGISEEDLDWQISLPMRVEAYALKNFRNKAEARFLARKDQLDRVVYSLLRTKDAFLSQELFLRIKAGEANFGDLAEKYSEGSERGTKGIVGPVSLTQAHPQVAEALRTTKPGVLMLPFRVHEWWLVMRLESYTPATFDESMATVLSKELFDLWVSREVDRRIIVKSWQKEAKEQK